jgi:multicomponent Na+:H+ antiporter subunit E
MNQDANKGARAGTGRPWLRRSMQALALFGLWVLLSGHLVREFLALGVVSAVGAVVFTAWVFHGSHEGAFSPLPRTALWRTSALVRFAAYVPWLIWQIITSNLHVVRLVVHPRMPIEPSLVLFETSLTSEPAQVLLAQSITLTPGTVTVDAANGRFLIHCISRVSREGIADGSIQRKVAAVFGEPSVSRVELVPVTTPEQAAL